MMLPSFWNDSRAAPFYGVAASALFLLIQGLRARYTSSPLKNSCTQSASPLEQDGGLLRNVFRAHGSRRAFLFKLTRALCCVALFCISLVLAYRARPDLAKAWNSSAWMEISQCIVYGYMSVLAVTSLVLYQYGELLGTHLTFTLLVTLGVYVYRNIAPLFLRGGSPMDVAKGTLMWVIMGLLAVAGVAIPLFAPPASLRDGSVDVNEEEEASIFSLWFYSWLDSTVVKASRVTHLPVEDLPFLAPTDSAASLVEESFPIVDPFRGGNKRHLFWSLLSYYRKEYLACIVLYTISGLLPLTIPIAMEGLLGSLELNGSTSRLYPWAWISFIFMGQTFGTLARQWGMNIIRRHNVQIQAIITELLFQHALRSRVKSEFAAGADADAQSRSSTPTNGEGKTSDSPKNVTGQLNNLVTSDLENIKNGTWFWPQTLVEFPLQLIGCIFILYHILGWSAFVGLGTICLVLPLPGYLSNWLRIYQDASLTKMDARVQTISEILGVARMIKLFGWEPRVKEQIKERREEELEYLRKARMMQYVNNSTTFAIPLVVMAITFSTYTLIQKEELKASRLFPALTAFENLQNMQLIFNAIPMLLRAMTSLNRINAYLQGTELLDEFEVPESGDGPVEPIILDPDTGDESSELGIARTTFTWTKEPSASGSQTPASGSSSGGARRRFALHIEEPLLFQRGRINLVLGPTGAGKTSLLMALLGEMHAVPAGPDAFVRLPRTPGKVAYAAQESWIQNETIRDNILFGSPFDEARYNKVIKQCALERDLSLFPAGDQTEVGEKGITLSGGQKARVTLARAVYSQAEVLLLDDVLAALDVQTGKWIVDSCFMGDLVRGRTVILVSHNIALARPIADFVVALGNDGRIISQGSLDKALKEDDQLFEELKAEVDEMAKAEQEVDASGKDEETLRPGDGKLIVAEEIGEGRVGWKALQLYLGNSSSVTWLHWTIVIIASAAVLCIMNGMSYFLGTWATEYETKDPSEISVLYHISVYLALLAIGIAIYGIGYMVFVYGSIRASIVIHTKLIDSVLGTTLRWLDTVPTSRIITRCTTDIQAVDTTISQTLHQLIEGTLFMILKVVSVAIVLPLFVIPAVVTFALGGWLSVLYMHAQLSVKREMSNAQAPVLGHFGGAITGLVSIRAYGAQEAFMKESYKRIDHYSRTALIFTALTRWVSVRVNLLGVSLTTALAVYLTYVAPVGASNTGFSLSMAIGFSGFILGWFWRFNEFQVIANSLERIQQYLEIEQEAKPTEAGVPPAYWPASGALTVEKLSARYSPDGPRVLHELSFEIKSGERVGIVGRTGSGKSSLTLSLLRCIPTEGKVYYDGIPTDSLNLDALRSNITIIPQMPELLSGTLRQNLDPFGQHDDAALNDALRSAGLFALQERTAGAAAAASAAEASGSASTLVADDEQARARLTLDSDVAGGGANLSVGQRQIVALARAIVRASKVLILDEATSAIDYETDAVIQKSLREELGKDVTVLTVAHRLQSVMDADKIMVLDAGRIVEFDSPSTLLKAEGGYFRGLVDGSMDRATLYAMAGVAI